MEWNWGFVTLPYNDRWRTQRKLFVQHLHPTNSELINPVIHEFVQKMLHQLRDAPDDFIAITHQ